MTSQTGRVTSHNDSASGKMQKLDAGSEQCELSEKTPQIGSESLDNEQSVLGNVLTSSVIHEKTNQVSDQMIGSVIDERSNQVSDKMMQSSVIDEKSNQVSDKMTESSVIQLPAPPQHDLEKSCQTAEGSCLQQSTLEQAPVHLSNDISENKCQPFSQNAPNMPIEISDAVNGFLVEDQTLSIPEQVNISSANELKDPAPASEDVKNISSNCLDRKSNSTSPMRLRCNGKKNSKLLKKKYMLRSLGSSDRALRSRTHEKPKPPESNSNSVDVNNEGLKSKRGRKKKKRRGEGVIDEFSRIRARLRYLLNRVSYEQSLIDAYSGEGWKGYRCVNCTITLFFG